MDTKKKILEVAFQFFLTEGYENTSLSMIAQKIGISKPAIYHHYKNKDELFKEVVMSFFQLLKNMTKKMLDNCDTTQQLIETYCNSLNFFQKEFSLFVGSSETFDVMHYMMMFDAIRRFEDIRGVIDDFYTESIAEMTTIVCNDQKKGTVRKDIDAEIFAFQLNALIEGSLLIAVLGNTVNLERVGYKMYENLWTSVRV